jgi:glycosyltransferase involved in cell wall biosynthesis
MAILGIDASNIQGGGGVTHLRELLAAADPSEFGFSSVVVWGGRALDCLPIRAWLKVVKIRNGLLSGLDQVRWNQVGIFDQFAKENCDLIFSPGGTLCSRKLPFVSMSQNMLLYESTERRRFPLGKARLRYWLLKRIQRSSFRRSRGIIFISNYAKKVIESQFPFTREKPSKVIYHGVNSKFFSKRHRDIESIPERGYTILYVSRVNFYKHQWNVVDAVDRLNRGGIKCNLRLVGGGQGRAMERLRPHLERSDCTVFLGDLPYENIDQEYLNADLFIFASTCENMPNILVEAMAAGLPIACSSYGPMPEVLGNGVYFDPTDVTSIKMALSGLLADPQRLRELAAKNRTNAERFSWFSAAKETFQFLSDCIPSQSSL